MTRKSKYRRNPIKLSALVNKAIKILETSTSTLALDFINATLTQDTRLTTKKDQQTKNGIKTRIRLLQIKLGILERTRRSPEEIENTHDDIIEACSKEPTLGQETAYQFAKQNQPDVALKILNVLLHSDKFNETLEQDKVKIFSLYMALSDNKETAKIFSQIKTIFGEKFAEKCTIAKSQLNTNIHVLRQQTAQDGLYTKKL